MPPISHGVVGALAGAHAAMDISDALVMDAGRIARASHAIMQLDEQVIDDLAGQLAVELAVDAARARQAILFAGEDHALLMTFPASATLPEGFLAIGAVVACGEGESPHVNLGNTAISENGWNPYTGWNGETS